MRRLSDLFLVSHLQTELNRLFREALEPDEPTLEGSAWQPRVDVIEREDSVVIEAEVAGMGPEDLTVEVAGGRVTIRGNKRPAKPGGHPARYICMERDRGRFERRLRIPQAINSHRGQAWLDHGILTIEFPRVPDQRSRPLALEVRAREEAE